MGQKCSCFFKNTNNDNELIANLTNKNDSLFQSEIFINNINTEYNSIIPNFVKSGIPCSDDDSKTINNNFNKNTFKSYKSDNGNFKEITTKFSTEKALNLLKRLQANRRFFKNNEFYYFNANVNKLQKKKLHTFYSNKLYNKINNTIPDFNIDGWKDFYSEQDGDLNFKKNINSLNCLMSNPIFLRIVDCNYVYLGGVNVKSKQPNGYGSMFKQNGEVLKGVWVEGKLEGWCRLCFEKYVIDGKKY